MSTAKFTGARVLSELKEATIGHTAFPTDSHSRTGEPRIVPRDLRQWLARLRLLEGVPFAYLVADSELLPPESVRFFYLDRNWTDALVQGALSVGTLNSADRAQLEPLYGEIRRELDEEERDVRMPGGEPVQRGTAGVITGFLLRSRAVSGWPGMHVRAYSREVGGDEEIVPESHPNRLKLLRLERLAPAVLFALFDGIPQLVHLEEPRQGLQFGVRLSPVGSSGNFSAAVVARDRNTTEDVVPETMMPVAFRPNAPGVLDLRRTAQNFIDTPQTNTGPDLDGAEFALQMIRFPYRQVFGRTDVTPRIEDVFRPTIGYRLSDLEIVFRENVT
ncbi:MAG: hypothetical protein BroJett029_00480 [Alphaproteobacteria bacterium]|nr:MAG: hypothetical protein BroJett029_00480 [Alphaproteobacteria bacterium]